MENFETVSSGRRLLRHTVSDSKHKTEKEQAAVTQSSFHVFFLRWPLIHGQPLTDSLWCVAVKNSYGQERGREDIEEQEEFVFFKF